MGKLRALSELIGGHTSVSGIKAYFIRVVFLHLLNGSDKVGHILNLRTANLIIIVFSDRHDRLVGTHNLIVLSCGLLPCLTLNPCRKLIRLSIRHLIIA